MNLINHAASLMDGSDVVTIDVDGGTDSEYLRGMVELTCYALGLSTEVGRVLIINEILDRSDVPVRHVQRVST